MKLRITILKYNSRYLCQISLQIMLLPIVTPLNRSKHFHHLTFRMDASSRLRVFQDAATVCVWDLKETLMPKYNNHFARNKYDVRTKKLEPFDKIVTCSFIFAWMQRSVMKQKINGFLNSQAQVHLSAVCFKCRYKTK